MCQQKVAQRPLLHVVLAPLDIGGELYFFAASSIVLDVPS